VIGSDFLAAKSTSDVALNHLGCTVLEHLDLNFLHSRHLPTQLDLLLLID